MTRILDAAELCTLASGLAARPELWRPHLRPDPARRTFHALVREPHATVWLICWMDGHDTGFHDHDGAAGAVAVVQGRVCEERLRLGRAARQGGRSAREGLTLGPPHTHRVTRVDGAAAGT